MWSVNDNELYYNIFNDFRKVGESTSFHSIGQIAEFMIYAIEQYIV